MDEKGHTKLQGLVEPEHLHAELWRGTQFRIMGDRIVKTVLYAKDWTNLYMYCQEHIKCDVCEGLCSSLSATKGENTREEAVFRPGMVY